MPTQCSVSCCKNIYSKTDKIHLFGFPRDQQIKQKWIDSCGRKRSFDVKNARICSNHFLNDDFENLLEFELAGTQLRLKRNAIPSRNLTASESATKQHSESDHCQRYKQIIHKQVVEGLLQTARDSETHALRSHFLKIEQQSSEPSSEPSSAQFENYQRSVNKEIVEELLQTTPDLEICSAAQIDSIQCSTNEEIVEESLQTETNITQNIVEIFIQEPELDPELTKLLDRIAVLEKEKKVLIDRVLSLKSERDLHLKKRNKSELEKIALKKEFIKLKNEQDIKHKKELYDVLSRSFTPTQLDILLNKKKRVTWSEQDIVNAFSLRYISKKSYIYMRKILHYPLPGLSTLQSWASKVSLKSGLFHEILQMLEIAAKKMSDINKIAVLQYGEMKVSEKLEYDVENNSNLGPYKYIQIIQVRSLFGKWKQPIYCNFDQKMTKEILFEVISALHEIGITVSAYVSDCGSSNHGLWTTLGLTVNEPWINHPNDDGKIFFFADAPHLLKLIRNLLLDHGFEWNGQSITIEPISLLMKSKKELTSAFKCTELHTECKGVIRQRTRLAAELLSNTVSKCLQRYIPENETENQKIRRETTARFIKIVNDWFDVMNSYTRDASMPLKSVYGVSNHFENQTNALHKMFNMIENITCNGNRDHEIFQDEIQMSINSLKNLFLDLKQKYPTQIQFIMTYKLNLDALENLFSLLRVECGPNDHPTPLDVLNRLKLLSLGKSIPMNFQSNANSAERVNDEEYIAGRLIRTLPSKSQTKRVKCTNNKNKMKNGINNANNGSSKRSIRNLSNSSDGSSFIPMGDAEDSSVAIKKRKTSKKS